MFQNDSHCTERLAKFMIDTHKWPPWHLLMSNFTTYFISRYKAEHVERVESTEVCTDRSDMCTSRFYRMLHWSLFINNEGHYDVITMPLQCQPELHLNVCTVLSSKVIITSLGYFKVIWDSFIFLVDQWFSLTYVISYWYSCIWLAESKFVSENHWQMLHEMLPRWQFSKEIF